ncbi:MAG: CatA-like O-acetyltransferase [Gemmatimonadota bacterium]|nr:CatA-like O-acetyltransferase [Gemmatimonadota bacterium]
MGHSIDLSRWKRREHFELYRGFSNPFFSVCADVDAGPTRILCDAPGGPSFFLATVFLALRAANEVEAFRTRVRGDGAWVHDQVSITPTVLRPDETFAFSRLEPARTFQEFESISRATVAAAKQIKPLESVLPDDDVIYHSTLPWIRFTAFSNALDGASDSVPRVVFGKCVKDGNRWPMPVGVEVHHAVVDGLDVARFFEKFEEGLQSFTG